MSNPLQNKLLHYEVPPPQGVWDKIASSLDENVSLTLSEKLYQYQQEPSAVVWQNIAAQLDKPTTEKAKIVPFYIRYRRPLKYSSAVAVFIFLAVITSLLISKKTESELPSQGVVNMHTSVKKDSSKPHSNSKENNSVSQISEKNYPEPAIAKSKTSLLKEEKNQSSFSLVDNIFPKQAKRNDVVSSSFNEDKYMIYSDGDGNAIRLPKKIFSAFACPANNTDCKQRLQQLRQKFAESAMTTDFTGLLQILKSLQENQ